MKITTTTILALSTFVSAHAQLAMDVASDANQFYACDGNTISQYTINGGVVSTVPSCNFTCPGTIYSLAYGNDIMNASTNRTLYASTMDGWVCSLLRWSGSSWDVLLSDSLMYLNGGAYGPYIYYLVYDYNVTPNTQSIVRLQSDGTLQTVFQDNSKVFTVADIAVDSLGNIYCFRGTSVGNTTELTVISPSGNVLASYATNLNYGQGYYGAMFVEGTLYLGQEDGGNANLWPITFAGGTATMGMPVYNNFSMTDLANGHGLVSNVTAVNETPKVNNSVSASLNGNYLAINNKSGKSITADVYDGNGKRLLSENIQQENTELDMNGLSNGVYVLCVNTTTEQLLVKKIRIVQ